MFEVFQLECFLSSAEYLKEFSLFIEYRSEEAPASLLFTASAQNFQT